MVGLGGGVGWVVAIEGGEGQETVAVCRNDNNIIMTVELLVFAY